MYNMVGTTSSKEENVYGELARTVDHAQCTAIMKLQYRLRRPLFIKGPPAIGKSDLVRQVGMQLAREMGLDYVEYKDDPTALNDPTKFVLIDLRLAQLDPSDLRGIPWVYALIRRPDGTVDEVPVGPEEKEDRREKKKHDIIKVPVSVLNSYPDAEILELVTRWSPPSDLPIAGNGIIFLDEMNLAAELNLKAAYQLILRRCLGEYKVPDGYGIFSAGNRQQDMASVTPFPSPLKSRFSWVELRSPSIEAWTNWAGDHGIHPWVIGFLQFKPSALDQFDPAVETDAQPTPRTWEFASDIMNDIGTSNLDQVRLMVCTVIGMEMANEFYAFIKMRDRLPPIDAYIRDPLGTPLNVTQTDILWTLLSGLAERYRYSDYDTKVLDACLQICYRIAQAKRTEMSVVFLTMLKSVDKQLKQKLEKSKIFGEISDELVLFVGKAFYGSN